MKKRALKIGGILGGSSYSINSEKGNFLKRRALKPIGTNEEFCKRKNLF